MNCPSNFSYYIFVWVIATCCSC